MTELKNSINKKEIPENENPENIISIVEKILNFNNQLKGKQRSRMLPLRPSDFTCLARVSDHSNLKILTPKQMFQRLPTALAQVKASNTSGNLLNEIRQIICFLYRAKEITEKVYDNIMNSIKL